MKRFLSMFLALILLLSTLASCSISSLKDDSVAGEDNKLTIGQWLTMVNDAFGMQSYTEETPYFKNVGTSNQYFTAVQIAAEWEVIDRNKSIDVNKSLNWETALVTLVNAGNFIDVSSNNADKIKYAIDNFDNSIKNDWMNKNISMEKAITLLSIAQEKWANKTYDKNVEELNYIDNVEDLSETVHTNYTIDDNTVEIPSELANGINDGDIYVLKSQENPLEREYYKAEKVSTSNGVTYIENSNEEVKLEDIVEDIKIQGTAVPTSENTIIYDGNGNPINASQVINASLDGKHPNFNKLSAIKTGFSNSHTFDVQGNKVSLSYNLDGNLDMKISVKTNNFLGKDSENKLIGEASFEISKIKVTHDFDYGLFKGLKYGLLKVDYETKTKFGVSYSKDFVDSVAAPPYSNGNGKFLTNFKRAVLKDQDGKGAKTIASKKVIKICSLNIYNAAVAKICLDVNLNIGVDGSLSITLTHSGSTGVEYKNKNLRFIKTNKRSAEAELKAQIELTLSVGPALYLIGLKKKLIGLDVQMGVGAEASIKLHLADSERHLIEELSFDDCIAEDCEVFNSLQITANAESIQAVAKQQGGIYKAEAGASVNLHVDTCFDVSAYGILKFGLSDNSFAASLLGGKIKLTCTVFSSKNAKFFNYHVDNWDWKNGVMSWGSSANDGACKLDYIPFDKEGETNDKDNQENENQQNNDNSVSFGEVLLLSEFRADINVGAKYSINITQLPNGYKLSDIVYESADKNIAKVDSKGAVEGLKGGVTTVKVKTKDGKFSTIISIFVVEDTKIDFEGIKV